MNTKFTVLLLIAFAIIVSGPISQIAHGQNTIGGKHQMQQTAITQNVLIARDIFGTPHVYARSDRSAYFGAGYAAAEDRFFQMSWRRLISQGRTAEFFGPGPITLNNGQMRDQNIVNDREMRVVGIARYADRIYPTLDNEIKQMLQAYADGVNRYINSPTASFHPLSQTHGIPVEDWRPQDCLGVWYSFA